MLTMATVFLLGVMATNAEPALNVLGHTVESLSGGRFSKRMLVWAVSVGVAIGMDAGGGTSERLTQPLYKCCQQCWQPKHTEQCVLVERSSSCKTMHHACRSAQESACGTARKGH